MNADKKKKEKYIMVKTFFNRKVSMWHCNCHLILLKGLKIR